MDWACRLSGGEVQEEEERVMEEGAVGVKTLARETARGKTLVYWAATGRRRTEKACPQVR